MGLGSFTGFAVGVSIVFFGVYLITSASLSGAPMTSPLQVPEVRRGENVDTARHRRRKAKHLYFYVGCRDCDRSLVCDRLTNCI
jgi:hypothetical protein